MSDILGGGSRGCPSCACRAAKQAEPPEVRHARAVKASAAAAKRSEEIGAERFAKYRGAWKTVYGVLAHAKRRCTDERNPGWKHYGGRGVKFKFASVFDAAIWVLENIGPPNGLTLDRIDNNRGYEPGNLRWATRQEQNLNKRLYTRGEEGLRARRLQALRPDLTEQTIRTWIKKGLTDDEIIYRRKHYGCGLRHRELRTKE